jgi:hypothetical protein
MTPPDHQSVPRSAKKCQFGARLEQKPSPNEKRKAGLVGPARLPCFPEPDRPKFKVRFQVVTATSKNPFEKSPLFKAELHDQCQVLQFMLKNRQRATGHFHATGSIQSRLRGNPIPTAHQEHLQQLSRFARIDHPTLEKIASQRSKFRVRKSFFHGRPHLRPFDFPALLDSAAIGNVACNSYAATRRHFYIRQKSSVGLVNPRAGRELQATKREVTSVRIPEVPSR